MNHWWLHQSSFQTISFFIISINHNDLTSESNWASRGDALLYDLSLRPPKIFLFQVYLSRNSIRTGIFEKRKRANRRQKPKTHRTQQAPASLRLPAQMYLSCDCMHLHNPWALAVRVAPWRHAAVRESSQRESENHYQCPKTDRGSVRTSGDRITG